MIIRVLSKLVSPPEKGDELVAVLVTDNWNDWYTWKTMYSVYLYDRKGNRHELGSVKIAELSAKGSENDVYRPLPVEFEEEALSDGFVSVGQDENYYATLRQVSDTDRVEYLKAMNDCAFNRYDRNSLESSEVFNSSLTRYVNWSTIEGRYRRLAEGNATPTRYGFTYKLPKQKAATSFVELNFEVEPFSHPPSNVHVLIGRNAVGKTRALNLMARALTTTDIEGEKFGSFLFDEDEGDDFGFVEPQVSETFSSVVSVSFSAFDKFSPVFTVRKGVTYHYVGLKKSPEEKLEDDPNLFEVTALEQKKFSELAEEFVKSARECRIGRRQSRWRKALETLESDPLFHEFDIRELANKKGKSNIKDLDFFLRLSSGHGIVLLIVTRLVELVEEQTLVLIDEPETHLHPPLLSAFVRTISEYMVNTNGVAILATHSPVVLQEAPRSCCYKLIRHGNTLKVERPEIETFGENVGTLTREVFGLEVIKSGFHNLLENEAKPLGASYEEILNKYDNQIGAEGRMLVRSFLQNKNEN